MNTGIFILGMKYWYGILCAGGNVGVLMKAKSPDLGQEHTTER